MKDQIIGEIRENISVNQSVIENCIDSIELAANVMEMNRVRQVQAQRAKAQKPKATPKPPVNPLKFP